MSNCQFHPSLHMLTRTIAGQPEDFCPLCDVQNTKKPRIRPQEQPTPANPSDMDTDGWVKEERMVDDEANWGAISGYLEHKRNITTEPMATTKNQRVMRANGEFVWATITDIQYFDDYLILGNAKVVQLIQQYDESVEHNVLDIDHIDEFIVEMIDGIWQEPDFILKDEVEVDPKYDLEGK